MEEVVKNFRSGIVRKVDKTDTKGKNRGKQIRFMRAGFGKGTFLALTTAVISGFAIFYSKIAVQITDPLVHVTLRTGFAALVLSVLMIQQNNLKKLYTLPRIEKILLLLIGVIGGSIPFILFFKGLSLTSAATANMLHKTLFIWVALLAVPLLRERINLPQGVGYALLLASNFLLDAGKGLNFSLGEGLVLTATIMWAIENVIAKAALRNIDSLTVAWARLTVGSTIILLVTLSLGKGQMLIALTWPQAFTILVGGSTLCLYVITWYRALALSPATHVSAILVLATLITNLLSAIFITHNLPAVQLISGLLAVCGTIAIVAFTKPITFAGRVSRTTT